MSAYNAVEIIKVIRINVDLSNSIRKTFLIMCNYFGKSKEIHD
jgi:hypothetical protein